MKDDLIERLKECGYPCTDITNEAATALQEMQFRIAELEASRDYWLAAQRSTYQDVERLDAALAEIESLDYRGNPHESAAIARKARAGD